MSYINRVFGGFMYRYLSGFISCDGPICIYDASCLKACWELPVYKATTYMMNVIK